ncbi:unnamed protein product [Periconia digitata]|uniref:Zn(2)-C6 fungal-type domain-containing protein n=1 Tax=Periconia digitata TaxID=1303443 RepID=A0A9W4UQL8_9PLEO|nr:unnamed protein product [Periconia digitata]
MRIFALCSLRVVTHRSKSPVKQPFLVKQSPSEAYRARPLMPWCIGGGHQKHAKDVETENSVLESQCDFQRPNCNSCLRAGARCHGYRDTESLRIEDETQAICSKPKNSREKTAGSCRAKKFDLNHIPLDLQVQARELFFQYFIRDFGRSWDFIYPYLNSQDTPEHVNLSIDAASLAFLSHHVTSLSAQSLGRSKYITALRKTNIALRTNMARDQSVLDSTLLLDLFEKIVNPRGVSDRTQRAHIEGSLALVKLRGLKNFTDSTGLKVLHRLSINVMIGCISQNCPLPPEIFEIRRHLSRFVDTTDPKFRSVGVIFDIVSPGDTIKQDLLSPPEKIRRCTWLDQQLEIISLEAAPAWTYERIVIPVGNTSQRILDNYYDVYNSRMTTQMWNALRASRILLCEEIEECSSTCQDDESMLLSQRATTASGLMISEICASVPQMTHCEGAAKSKLPSDIDVSQTSHGHTLSHFLDNYILLYALYVAGWSRSCQPRQREWIIAQLIHVGEHFRMKEAALVASILQDQTKNSMSERPRPWDVYRLLGSYAFAA